ncbi:hypothetical protein D3C71_1287860 [compost metagenome]
MRLGQRVQHGDVLVTAQQRGRGRLLGVLTVGLIHHHQRPALQRVGHPLDLAQRDHAARGIGRRAQEHQRGVTTQRRGNHGIDIGDQRIALIDQRHLDQQRVLQAGADGIHAEHRWRGHHRIAARLAQRAHQQIDGLVAATADQQLFGGAAVQLGKPIAQCCRLRVGIAARATRGVGGVGPRRFIRVEPDIPDQRTAARRGIAGKRPQVCTHQREEGGSAHAAASMRRVTAFSWASRPSARASTRAHSPIAAMPAAVADCTLIRFWKLATLTPL